MHAADFIIDRLALHFILIDFLHSALALAPQLASSKFAHDAMPELLVREQKAAFFRRA